MSKRLVVGVVLAGAISGGLLLACSSSDSHPAVLGGCMSTFGCEPQRPNGSADASGTDGTIDAPNDAPQGETSPTVDTGIDADDGGG